MTTKSFMSRVPMVVSVLLAVLAGAVPASADTTVVPPAALYKPAVEGKLNINTATAAQWALLPGIGPATARKLVDYRTRHRFRRISHVMRIKGVGRKTFAAIRSYLTLEGETTLHIVGPSPGVVGHR